MIWMKLLHQGAMGANDFRRAGAFRQAQNLVGLAARHRAGGPAPPPLTLTLVCLTPAGKPAVEISL